VICSAFLTMGTIRVFAHGITDPLAIQIDERLWALLGISTAALVGTPLIHSIKARKAPADPEALERARARTRNDTASNAGLLYTKVDPREADVTDMFTGDELGDADMIDMAKVQMFVFTVIAVLAYAVALYRRFDTGDASSLDFPNPSEGLIGILGISQAAYLAGKLPDRTK
jgi:hypothetical protein